MTRASLFTGKHTRNLPQDSPGTNRSAILRLCGAVESFLAVNVVFSLFPISTGKCLFYKKYRNTVLYRVYFSTRWAVQTVSRAVFHKGKGAQTFGACEYIKDIYK